MSSSRATVILTDIQIKHILNRDAGLDFKQPTILFNFSAGTTVDCTEDRKRETKGGARRFTHSRLHLPVPVGCTPILVAPIASSSSATVGNRDSLETEAAQRTDP
jgi:hypothetical protein